jgi:hypothetical protein
MTDHRKDLRIRLPVSADVAFSQAKAKAEKELGITMRDNEFATRVLVQGVRQWETVQDATPRTHLPENCRERWRLEGKTYLKSWCASCETGFMTVCPHKID